MSAFKKLEEKINNIVKSIGYDTDITLSLSNPKLTNLLYILFLP